MPDKLAEFRRINEPRVDKILASLGHIEKSATSMRIDEHEVKLLLHPVRIRVDYLRGFAAEQLTPAQPEPTEIKATAPVSQAGVPYADLPTTQLIDKMIAIGAILAERRK